MSQHRSRTTIVSVMVLMAAIVVGFAVSVTSMAPRAISELARLVPADVQSIDVTNWASIRSELAPLAGQQFSQVAADRELSSRSILSGSDALLDDVFGWSTRTVRWEAFVQMREGTAVFIGLPGGEDDAEARLKKAGYSRSSDGTWAIDVAQLSVESEPLPEYFARIRLIEGDVAVASADQAVIDRVVDVSENEAVSLADDPDAARVWDAATDRLAGFVLQNSEVGCDSTSAAEDGTDIAAQAAVAIEAAGDLVRYRWLVRGVEATGEHFWAMAVFDSAPVAAEQARIRARLATGPFIGYSGDIEDSIDLAQTHLEGSTVAFDFRRNADAVALMSFGGPLLLASC